MSEAKGVSGAALTGLSLNAPEKRASGQLGSEDFLKLLVEQLRNQNPTSPADSAQFLGQLAQFSTVSGIQDLQRSLGSITSGLQSSRALQASTMVGRTVVLEADRFNYGGSEGKAGAVVLEAPSAEVKVGVFNAAGARVKEFSLGAAGPGELAFKWDGLDAAGNAAPRGTYHIRATALTESGQSISLGTLLHARVESVSLLPKGGGTELNLSGYGPMALDAVRRVI
jgi:flagellar basal-body rod modification protein FlgD